MNFKNILATSLLITSFNISAHGQDAPPAVIGAAETDIPEDSAVTSPPVVQPKIEWKGNESIRMSRQFKPEKKSFKTIERPYDPPLKRIERPYDHKKEERIVSQRDWDHTNKDGVRSRGSKTEFERKDGSIGVRGRSEKIYSSLGHEKKYSPHYTPTVYSHKKEYSDRSYGDRSSEAKLTCSYDIVGTGLALKKQCGGIILKTLQPRGFTPYGHALPIPIVVDSTPSSYSAVVSCDDFKISVTLPDQMSKDPIEGKITRTYTKPEIRKTKDNKKTIIKREVTQDIQIPLSGKSKRLNFQESDYKNIQCSFTHLEEIYPQAIESSEVHYDRNGKILYEKPPTHQTRMAAPPQPTSPARAASGVN